MSKESKEEWGGDFINVLHCPFCNKRVDDEAPVDVIPLDHLLTDDDIVLVKQYWKREDFNAIVKEGKLNTFRCEDCIDRGLTKEQIEVVLKDQLNKKREYWNRILKHRKYT
jgi:hypothetical protein